MAQIIETVKKTTEYTIKLDAEEAEGLKILLHAGTTIAVLNKYHLQGLLNELVSCQELSEGRTADFYQTASLTPPLKQSAYDLDGY